MRFPIGVLLFENHLMKDNHNYDNYQNKLTNGPSPPENPKRSETKIMKDFVDYQKKSDETVSRLGEEIAKARTDLEMAYLKKVTNCEF